MLEMKAYFCLNEPVECSEVYITNNARIRKKLDELGIHYQGWFFQNDTPAKETKAPTLKILSEKAINHSPENPEAVQEWAVRRASEEKINLLLKYLQKERYTFFDDYIKFTRLEKFNNLPGRMLKFLILMFILWILWGVFFKKFIALLI